MKPPTIAVSAATALVAVLPLAGTSGAVPFGGHDHRGHDHRVVTTAADETFHLRLKVGPTVLPASGGTVEVKGAGYNRAQGIFLAFCAIPEGVVVGDPTTYKTLPGPCLPGRENQDGSSRRITDSGTGTPGITLPYEKGGKFRTTLEHVRPQIADGVVCDVTVRCAVVTRADFTATNDRLYDLYVPVHFAPAVANGKH